MIKLTTTYTKELLIKFSNYIAKTQHAFLCTMAFCAFIVYLITILGIVYDTISTTTIICAITLTIWNLLWLFLRFVFPRIFAKKSKNLGTVTTYTFYEDNFTYESLSPYGNSNGSVKLEILSKVEKKGSYLYMLLNRSSGNILDLSELSQKEIDDLERCFRMNLSDKKIKWSK